MGHSELEVFLATVLGPKSPRTPMCFRIAAMAQTPLLRRQCCVYTGAGGRMKVGMAIADFPHVKLGQYGSDILISS